ncbi:MAG: rod shape-determining protein MreD [Frankia sp.]|nr:rod shape-determining protein MreD [Frankia sp.]
MSGPHEDDGISPRVFAVAAVVLLASVIIQLSVVARLALPLGRPDLVLTLLAAIALVEGPATGALLGFTVGLFGDLTSTHVLGTSALVLCLVGYAAGLAADLTDRSVLAALLAIAGAAAGGTLGHLGLAALLGDGAVAPGVALPRALAAGLYAALVAPFLFPAVVAGLRRVRRVRP